MFQQQKAAPMVNSPSLKMGESKISSVGSGWVSLPSGKHAHKSFVGSVDRDPELSQGLAMMDQSDDDQPGSVTSKKFEEKKKFAEPPTHMVLSKAALGRMQGLLSGLKSYRVRLASPPTAWNAGGSGTDVLLTLWSPLANTEFTDFAALFTEYRLISHELFVQFAVPVPGGTQDGTITAGSDPAIRLTTGTSFELVRSLGNSKIWNPQNTQLHVASLKSGTPLCSSAVQANPLTRDGFQLVGDAWGGQTAVVSQFNPLSINQNIGYVSQVWVVDFRCRL